jgi:hypothetical protein
LKDKLSAKTNLGLDGIIFFFLTHKCNYYCKQLELINPQDRIYESLPTDFRFFSLKDLCQIWYDEIKIICELCKKEDIIPK